MESDQENFPLDVLQALTRVSDYLKSNPNHKESVKRRLDVINPNNTPSKYRGTRLSYFLFF
jgi:hypothetical protein